MLYLKVIIMKNRDLLQISSKIWLISNEDGSLGEFTITDICGQGGSSICYRATKNNRNGILKEFYPLDSELKQYAVNLSRRYHTDSKLRGQLYSEDTTVTNFINLRDIYYNSCQEIITAKTKEEELNNFIPRIEIFKSYTDDASDSNFTYYTWILEDTSMKSFDEILSDVCKDTENYGNRVKNTLLIIDCILELAKSVCLLHLSGLLHLDLTPTNFGVSTYMGSANKNVTISLYDTNTIYSQRLDSYIAGGTLGFRSPEVENGQKDKYSIHSDIYSIGAILYYAFVTDKNHKNCLYSREKYGKKSFDSIDSDLKNSVLLKSSDETTNTFLYNDLLSIIKKALNIYGDSCGKFEKTEDLIKAIEQLKNRFSILAGKEELKHYGADWIDTKTKTKEEHYNETIKTGAAGAIQWLLYKHPLYDYKINGNDLNVLVLGCGTYSPKFIDIALELSQINGLHLNLTVACENPSRDKDIFLGGRPEFCNFFSVDDSTECKRTVKPYGRIEFKKAHFDLTTSNMRLNRLFEEKNYSYIFIALNDEKLNKKVAQVCSKHLKDKNKAIVSYIVYNKTNHAEQTNNEVHSVPVCVTDILAEQDDYKYLEQMAFNAHLLWSPYGISDLKEAETTFYNDEYNYNSSLKNALSIKYKLHSIGIVLNSNDPNRAAADFKKLYEQHKDSLIMYEQRRWNVGQITDGWKLMERSEYGTLKTTTKNKEEKKHPIICDTSEATPLETWEKAKWDNAALADINCLDPLDQTSVYMYRHFAELSKNVRRNSNIIKGQLDLLSKIVHKNVRLTNLLSFFNNAVDKILNGDLSRVNLLNSYKYYKASFETELEAYNGDDIEFYKAKECLENIDGDLFPIIQSWSYKNWKNNNVDLIVNIPFILTYSGNIHICMPMVLDNAGRNSTLFFNVASAIKVHPCKITYIIDGDAVVKDEKSFIYALSFIYRLFVFHKVHAKIDLVILKNKYTDCNFINKDELKKKFEIINKIDFIDHDSSNKQAVLTSYLRDNQSVDNQENHFSALEYPNANKGDLYTLLRNANQNSGDGNNIVPAFYFEEKTQSFKAYDSACEWLNYISFEPSLHINELFEDNEVSFSEPELSHCTDFIYDILENEYDTWYKLCDIIGLEIKHNQKLTEIHINETDNICKNVCEFIFPSYCEEAVAKIVVKLSCCDIISSESDIIRLTSKSSLLRINNLSESCKSALEELFENYTWLRDESLIHIQKKDNNIIVYSDAKLNICNMLIDERFNMLEKQNCIKLLHKLSKEHLITGLRIKNVDENIYVSFMFPSVYEKQLLSNNKKIVQAVIYYKLLESEIFDDVQSGVKINLNNDTSVQVDAIATKGLATFLFVTEPMFSDVLISIKEKYGINCKLILVKRRDTDKNNYGIDGVHTFFVNDDFQSELNKLIKDIE